ncbi:MAG: hypothetical protein IJ529_04675 [Alphaproteobacteria bacterium]|nr:hypothetical protein [Alphaproteobacteria bacterium]MBQ9236183.1 hypothetical protein [Alphaproteobacteria bacterium]
MDAIDVLALVVLATMLAGLIRLIVIAAKEKKNNPKNATDKDSIMRELFGPITYVEEKGLGLEPPYNGKMPHKIEFEVGCLPRYVYENLQESEKMLEGCGRIIGYRIGEDLVIGAMIGGDDFGWLAGQAARFIEYYNGRLLTFEQSKVLAGCLRRLDELRSACGDTPMPRMWWIKGFDVFDAVTGDLLILPDLDRGGVVMAL